MAVRSKDLIQTWDLRNLPTLESRKGSYDLLSQNMKMVTPKSKYLKQPQDLGYI